MQTIIAFTVTPPAPIPVVASDLTPPSITPIFDTYTGDLETFIAHGGVPDGPYTYGLTGPNAADFDIDSVTGVLSVLIALSAGPYDISITAENSAGVATFSRPVTVTTTPDEAQDTPDPPDWGREVEIAGNFPTTITDVVGIPSGISIGESFSTFAALKSRLLSLGGSVIVNCPADFEGDIGAADGNLAFVAPYDADGLPTALTQTFQTTYAGQAPGQEAYMKGFKVGPPDSLLNQPRAYALASVGPYVMQAGDPITQGTTTARVISYTNDSGSVAAGTGVGRLVVSEQFGNFSAISFNIGANIDVGTFSNSSFRYGPQRQTGAVGVKHNGRGRMTIVRYNVRNVGGNGIASDGDQDMYDVSSQLWCYDGQTRWCGSAGQDTQHNIYAHYCDFRHIRSISVDCPSGHTIKAETRRAVILDGAAVRDTGEVDAIGTKVIATNTTSTTIPLNGWAVSGGVVTPPEPTLGRVICDGDLRGYFFEFTGTSPSDAVISEKFRGAVNGCCYTNQIFKTFTAPIGVTAISGQSQLNGTAYAGYGIGLTHEMPEINLSQIQDKRVARMLVSKNGIAQGGARMMNTSRRTSKLGGVGPPPKSRFCVDGDSELGTGGNLIPWASNLMNGTDSKYMVAGLLNGDHPASTTDFRSSAWQWAESDNGLLLNPIEPGVDYDVAAQRNDGTILNFTAKVTNGTFTAGAGANTITISGLTGFGGTMPFPTSTSNAVAVRLTTSGTLPAPLALNTNYYYAVGGGLATSAANAFAGTRITTTTAGTGTHKLHCFSINAAAGGTDVRFPIGTTYGGSSGANKNRFVAMKKASQPWDTALPESTIFNKGDPNYRYAPDGPCLTGGAVDFDKQGVFETGYCQDILYCADVDNDVTLYAPEAKFYHVFHVNGSFSIELPKMPLNRPQGQWSLSCTSAGTYQPVIGDVATGAISGATGTIGGFKLISGTLAAGDGVGIFYFTAKTGTFQAENIDIGANLNVATVAGAAVMDWPDIATAGTFVRPFAGSGSAGWGRHPVGYVGRDDRGPNCDYVQLYVDQHKDIGYFLEGSRFTGTLNQFGGYPTGADLTNVEDNPDSRYVNVAGAAIPVTSANRSPMPASSYTRLNGAHAVSSTKLYVAGAALAGTAGQKILMALPLKPGAIESIYIGSVVSAGSDGGGSFINVTPGLPRAAANRAQIACFTQAGTPPSYWVNPEDYLVR